MPNANPRQRAIRAGVFATTLASATWLLASSHVPCGVAHLFHVPCPGCGSTRAMLALASGDLAGCLRYNPLAPFMTALVLTLAVQALVSLFATGTFRQAGAGALGVFVTRGMLVVAGLEVLVWLARFGGALGGPVPV